MEEEFAEFGGAARVVLFIFGLAAIAAAFPIGFLILVLLGGGHGNPFGPAPLSEWLFRLALLAVPLLLLIVGLFSIRCRHRRDLRKIAYAILLIPACILLSYSAIAVTLAGLIAPAEGSCGDLPQTVCAVGEMPQP